MLMMNKGGAVMETRRTRTLTGAVLTVGVAVAAWGMLPGARGEATAQPLTPLCHFKCYDITPGTALHEPVTLTDQFGEEAVTVRAPQMLCAPVFKKVRADGTVEPCPTPVGVGGASLDLPRFSVEDHLKCYKITPSGPPPNQPATVFDQFHPHTTTGGGEAVTVRTPQLLCAPAQKCLPGGRCPFGPPEPE